LWTEFAGFAGLTGFAFFCELLTEFSEVSTEFSEVLTEGGELLIDKTANND
jgi:hypothetical protein